MARSSLVLLSACYEADCKLMNGNGGAVAASGEMGTILDILGEARDVVRQVVEPSAEQAADLVKAV